MNYRIVLHVLGWVVGFEAVCMLLPLICAVLYNEPYIGLFLTCISICLIAAVALLAFLPKNKSIYAKEGFVIVALSWILISLFGALPFTLSGYIPNFIDAVFETVSGFTTTGASILKEVETLPKCLLFWRSFTHWIGGMGVLVFLVAVLPLSGGHNVHLIKAESPGPSVSKLVPKVRNTAMILYGIYIFLTLCEVVFLLAGDLSMFESLTLTFGTAGTGGFAVRNSSLADYSSYVQIVITVFMALFGVDFSFYYLLMLKKFRLALRMDEVRVYFGVLVTSSIIICLNCANMFDNIFISLKHSAFQVSSIMTTTGFVTTDFDKWPELSKTILVTLMCIGACAGSTGGGIKVSRIIILLKATVKQIRIAAHPKIAHKITINGRIVPHETIRAINVFMTSYIVIFALSVLLISIDNFDLSTNFTAVAATLNNIGPGLAKVGPTQNFSIYSPFSTIVLTFDMLLGRLEIFPILILFSPVTWKR